MLIDLKPHRWIGLSVMAATTFSVGAQATSEGPNLRDLEEINIPELRWIGLRIQGVIRGA